MRDRSQFSNVSRGRPAVAAGAAQHDVVRGEVVAAAPGDAGERRFKRRVLERLDLPAVPAHEVMVVVAAGRALEAGDTVPEVDALYETELSRPSSMR